ALIGFIYIYVPLTAIQDVFRDSFPLLFIGGSVFFILLFLIINHLWKRIFRPLDNLQSLALEVSKGNYTNQIPVEGDDDLRQLTKAVIDMSMSLAKQEERTKEFTSNILQEIRTPLTYINGYTEALKQKAYTSTKEAENYLSTIQKETIRLSKLVNDLADS